MGNRRSEDIGEGAELPMCQVPPFFEEISALKDVFQDLQMLLGPSLLSVRTLTLTFTIRDSRERRAAIEESSTSRRLLHNIGLRSVSCHMGDTADLLRLCY